MNTSLSAPIRPRLLIVLVLAVLWSDAGAQHYPFGTYTELEGLPSSAIHSMAQDLEGQLWFATRAGLVVHDGLDWRVEGGENGLADRIYGHVRRDARGRLWAVTSRPPVQAAVRENGRWRALPRLEALTTRWQIMSVAVDTLPGGRGLLGVTSHAGYLALWDGDRWQEPDTSPAGGLIHSLATIGGKLLASSRNGLLAWDVEQQKLVPADMPGLPTGPVLAVAEDAPGEPLWIVGETWLARHDGRNVLSLTPIADPMLNSAPTAVRALADGNGGLYYGDAGRVWYYHPAKGRPEYMSDESGLVSGGVTDLMLGREGSVWFAGLRGVSRLVSRRFTHFDENNGLFRDEVSAIQLLASGEVALGHEGGLTLVGETVRQVPFLERSPHFGRVIDLEEDADGDLWAAADRRGLLQVVPNGVQRWRRIGEPHLQGVFAVVRDARDRLWVGTRDGLYLRQGDGFALVELPSVASPRHANFVRRLVAGRDGSLWVVAGMNGVFRLRDGAWDHWTWSDPSEHGFFNLCEMPDGVVLVGTTRGLYRIAGGALVKCAAPLPSVDRPVYALISDSRSRLWLGTDDGVFLWTGTELRHFSSRSGLLGSESNRDALKEGPDGRIWIGTDRGLSVYDDAFDRPPTAAPIVQLLGFDIDASLYDAGGRVELSEPPHALTARFRMISFADRPGLGVSAWLENFEDDWQPPVARSQRTVRYTNLPPGEYRLHLRAVDEAGLASDAIASSTIVVQPPFYARWWFIALLAAATILAVRALLGFYSQKRYAHRLRSEVAARTEQLQRSEQSERDASQRLGSTINSLHEGVLTLDADGRVTLCNPAAERVLGGRCEQLAGQDAARVLPFYEAVAGGLAGPYEMALPGRGTVWIEASAAPITTTDGRELGTVIALRDVTERRLREDEQMRSQKLESLGLLAGGIAHDFNNLLTIIAGNVELVGDGDHLADSDRALLAKSQQAAKRAKALTEQLLTFARGGAPQRRTLSLADAVHDAAFLVFSGTAHNYRQDLAPDLWTVSADPGQIGQVLSNVFINACQAMPAGGLVHVAARNVTGGTGETPAGRWVQLEISDEGEGIPEENLQKIFDPYFTTKEHGSGLGLATAYSIIKRHQGHLRIDSAPGRGTTVRILLPPGEGDDARPAPAPVRAVAPGQRILVMDDEHEVCLLIERFLRRMGLEAVSTAEGGAAIAAYNAAAAVGRPFAAILCDLTVAGGLGGRETVARLREKHPDLKAVVISGYSRDAVLSDYRRHGFAAALPKPFDFDDLAAVLGEVLSDVGPA